MGSTDMISDLGLLVPHRRGGTRCVRSLVGTDASTGRTRLLIGASSVP